MMSAALWYLCMRVHWDVLISASAMARSRSFVNLQQEEEEAAGQSTTVCIQDCLHAQTHTSTVCTDWRYPEYTRIVHFIGRMLRMQAMLPKAAHHLLPSLP
jgi:hypothetical protein